MAFQSSIVACICILSGIVLCDDVVPAPHDAPPPAPHSAEELPHSLPHSAEAPHSGEAPVYSPHYSPFPTFSPFPAFADYKPNFSHKPPSSYHSRPSYGHQRPSYGHHRPAHKPPPKHAGYKDAPECAANTTKTYCLEDYEYPEYEIKNALERHAHKVLAMYADVSDLSTEISVDRLQHISDEVYLCPSETDYIRPLRAVNTEEKWRIIVNNIKVDYEEYTQTCRVEECLTEGEHCPIVTPCYDSKCVQKFIVNRFLVYDPYDQYFPFAIDTFKLPASCACYVGAYYLEH